MAGRVPEQWPDLPPEPTVQRPAPALRSETPSSLPRKPKHDWRVARITIGILLAVGGVLWVPFCLFLAVLTANPCGAFGDHCDDYGQVTSEATAFFFAAFLGLPVAIGGFVLALVSWLNGRSGLRSRGSKVPA